MAEAATGPASAKPRWARPGSGHDRLVRWSKVALPSAVGVIVAVLAVAPLHKKGDVSFILDKNKVQSAPEQMRVEGARYTGTDEKGQQFVMTANRAVQRSSENPIVDIAGMFARIDQAHGPMVVSADHARYNLESQRVAVDGPVHVSGADGFRLNTSNVLVDLKTQRLATQAPAEGATNLGQFRANRVTADLTTHTVVLQGGARLKIVQGAVR
jgi:lipopolysaccharide export system protein LptC